MNTSLLLWVALAVSVFWGVGLYNRLMRMRARGLSALGSVEKHMRLYAALVREQVTLRGPRVPQDSPNAWDNLMSSLQVFEHALKDDGVVQLTNEPLARLVAAFDGVQVAWRHLSAVPPDLAGPVIPAELHAQWEAVALRVETARGGFNQILTQYNAALDQFPARLVVGWMGFKPGGTL
jgi:LemA protein